jgi:hypothetical protein
MKGNKYSLAQITYFIYNAIFNKFPQNTKYLHWEMDIPMKKDDILISCIPNRQLKKFPGRSIIVDNDNFEVGKWKRGKFEKYGINSEINYTYPFNDFMIGVYGAIFKTNDIAIRKWNNDNEDVLEKKQFLLSNIKHIEIVQHPMDKDYFSKFYDPNLKHSKLKMLVYDAGPTKNAKQLTYILKNYFSQSSFEIITKLQKNENNVMQILSEFAYLAHTSYSEGFPYFANEFLCQGLPLYGHEEWWEPYGNDILKWTYDPSRQSQNLTNLKTLLSDDFKDNYYKMRNELIQTHLDRKDNNWNFLIDKLFIMIENLLVNC